MKIVRSIRTHGRKAIGSPTVNHAKISITMESDIFDALNRIVKMQRISFAHAARLALRKGLELLPQNSPNRKAGDAIERSEGKTLHGPAAPNLSIGSGI
jgi:hypothetical protein